MAITIDPYNLILDCILNIHEFMHNRQHNILICRALNGVHFLLVKYYPCGQ